MAIKSFKQKWLEDFYYKDIKASVKPQLRDRIFRKLKLIEYANCLEDLRAMPGNRLHALKGDRRKQWAIAINAPWQLCFYFEEGAATDVELTQYH